MRNKNFVDPELTDTPLKLHIRRFEGSIMQIPLAREPGKLLAWEMELHGEKSRGGFVVEIGGKRHVTHELQAAIDIYNGVRE